MTVGKSENKLTCEDCSSNSWRFVNNSSPGSGIHSPRAQKLTQKKICICFPLKY
ncbi:hypothetical protein M5D96_002723 [Drosophila gunungcola]|uniref:Uncharacterized protein n=1 Tax=Drosophila gunungcola TaxID=103775 RepID=A0A9P9Z0J2_9MUSC|nr:hypothetical protein M5D96_002723 [Drosophila gunungcola]